MQAGGGDGRRKVSKQASRPAGKDCRQASSEGRRKVSRPVGREKREVSRLGGEQAIRWIDMKLDRGVRSR